MTMDLSPIIISLKTATLSIIITFFLGVAAAQFVFRLKSKTMKTILDGLFTLPLVLPPTVAGFFLLYIFGMRRPIGKFLNEYFEKNGLTFAPDMELATTDLILPAVRHNLGIGFVPEEFAEEEKKAENVFEIEVEEKLPTRNIILIYDTEYPQSIASKEFQKFLSSQKN